MRTPEADVLYVLTFISVCLYFLIGVETDTVVLFGSKITSMFASWTGIPVATWMLYVFQPVVVLIACAVVSFLIALLFQIKFRSDALLGGIATALLLHFLYDNFKFGVLADLVFLHDLSLVLGASIGLELSLLASRVWRTRVGNAAGRS